MKRIVSLSVLGLTLGVSACGAPEEAGPEPIRPARIETVQSTSGPSQREFVGRVEARITVDMAFQVGGRLTELPVTEGEVIEEGALLAQLELQDFQRAYRQAQVQLEQAQNQLTRQETLNERGIASQAALDDARTARDLQRVAVDNARQNIEYATIHAPFNALVSRRLVDNYTTVSPGQPVMRLQDVSELRVAISVPEAIVAQFDETDVVSLEARFAYLPDQVFELEYRELVAEPQATSQTYTVLLALPENIPANILPGMSASVRVVYNNGRSLGGIDIPLSALDSAPSGELRVWVYDPETGEVHARQVETQELNDNQVRIISGLDVDEQIVTAGVSALVEGMKVRPVESQSPLIEAQR